MKVVTIIVAAEEEDCVALAGSDNPLNQWSGIEATGLDTVRIATLHSLLTGDSLQEALDCYEPVYVGENETVILRVADALQEKLLELDEDALETLGEELAANEEFEEANCDAEDMQMLLASLADLARLADSQGQALMVWMSFPELQGE